MTVKCLRITIQSLSRWLRRWFLKVKNILSMKCGNSSVNDESLRAALSSVEKLYKLTKRKETESKRFKALFELTRKIRASLNTIYLIPYEQYSVLYAPLNLLYRSMITDLMTSLLFLLVDDGKLDDFLLVDNWRFADAMISALDTDVEIRSLIHPKEADDFKKLKEIYQKDHYDDLKECLMSGKNDPWVKKRQVDVAIKINGEVYTGQIKEMYKILKSSQELCGYAYLYKYYREFSQSEHYSIKGGYMNYKQDFHDKYYNKVLDSIHLGEKLIYDKYYGQEER